MADKTHWFDECYIVMSQYGIQRTTKRPGKLARGEIAIRVRLVVPKAAFEEPPISAEIVVPESAVIRPRVSVTVQDAPTPTDSAGERADG
ncbi:MAG: hypothetical protein ABS87_01085 [Sphingomonas sp. SCN 67-18]|uniref:hypothetical protein n=1 Tax=uncultured Sphingomonas sp. TaxID=158754 RepID=UPI00086F5A6C|nr:hypothetical protein [Sphingomonas sp. SCN 67-18]ODU22793.1 MAG: hypothetical protein ABS87_01085 [Sphingomonas sp. SCN 67-18]